LFGKVVSIVQGGEIGDAFFCLVTRVRIDYLEAISGCKGVKKIHQPNLVILVEPPSGFAMLESSFYDQETRGEGEDLFEFMEKRRAIVGGI
jgi:hypothetical protein